MLIEGSRVEVVLENLENNAIEGVRFVTANGKSFDVNIDILLEVGITPKDIGSHSKSDVLQFQEDSKYMTENEYINSLVIPVFKPTIKEAEQLLVIIREPIEIQ